MALTVGTRLGHYAVETQHELRAPVRARIVVPMQFVPNLITALQEHLRLFSEGTPKGGIALKGSVH